MTTVRAYELYVTERDGAERSQLLKSRSQAEELADSAIAAAAAATVWAIDDAGSYKVYQLEETTHGVMVSRLRARLRHPHVTPKQRRLLETLQTGGDVQVGRLKSDVGRYAGNTIVAALKRGWISWACIADGVTWMKITELGRAVLLAQQTTNGDHP